MAKLRYSPTPSKSYLYHPYYKKKKKNPSCVSDYRPISLCLCNVLYKNFSKVFANRLKKFLNSIITKHQSAFAKGCLITDNILIAFETFHSMKHCNSGSNGFMALKFDMS